MLEQFKARGESIEQIDSIDEPESPKINFSVNYDKRRSVDIQHTLSSP